MAREEGRWPVGADGPESLDAALKSWTDQAGMPLVTVSRDYGADSFSLSQSVYVENGEVPDIGWDIPISYASAELGAGGWNRTVPSLWLTQGGTARPATVRDEGLDDRVALVLNVQATGYFRVNYDAENWRMIGDTLANDKDLIHPLNRAQIICDVFSLANNGVVSEDIKNHVLGYIEKEDDFTPKHAYETCGSGFRDVPEFVRI